MQANDTAHPDEYCLGCNEFANMCKCRRIEGVGPETPIATNADGGRQSDIPYRCDLLPPQALLQIAAVLKAGNDKYGPHNWRKIPRQEHLNHALTHVLAQEAGDTQDHHLAHAACRLLFALETK